MDDCGAGGRMGGEKIPSREVLGERSLSGLKRSSSKRLRLSVRMFGWLKFVATCSVLCSDNSLSLAFGLSSAPGAVKELSPRIARMGKELRIESLQLIFAKIST